MDNVLKIRMSKGPDINRYLRLLRTPGTFADAQMICLKNSDAEYFTCNTICLPNKLRANVMIKEQTKPNYSAETGAEAEYSASFEGSRSAICKYSVSVKPKPN